MSDFFIIEQFISDINDNITNVSRLIYEIDASLKFINTSINELKDNHNDTKYRKYLLTILEKSKLAMYSFNSRICETKKFTFIELYSFYEILINVLNAINIYTKSTQLKWKCNYRITDDEYIVLEKI
jgi:hypothetical protein